MSRPTTTALIYKRFRPNTDPVSGINGRSKSFLTVIRLGAHEGLNIGVRASTMSIVELNPGQGPTPLRMATSKLPAGKTAWVLSNTIASAPGIV